MELTCECCEALCAEESLADATPGEPLQPPVTLSGVTARSAPCPRTRQWHCARLDERSLVSDSAEPLDVLTRLPVLL